MPFFLNKRRTKKNKEVRITKAIEIVMLKTY